MNELTLSLWRSAPLDTRLRFAAELLPSDDPMQAALKEAIGVVQLWRRGPELEAWAKAYPSLVVDTATALEATAGDDEAHQVAGALLREAKGLLDSSLRAMGFEWITPRAGEPPPQACRCEGTGDLVTECVRPGLRHHGVLLLPAEVRLGMGSVEIPPSGKDGGFRPIGPIPPITTSADAPEWLRTLQRSVDAPNLALLEALVSGAQPDDGQVIAAADRLREALQCEACGSALRSWLKEELNVQVLEPREGDAFEPQKMQAVSERRTVHEHEADTVARLELVGFAREGRVLTPAEVVRYVGGESW